MWKHQPQRNLGNIVDENGLTVCIGTSFFLFYWSYLGRARVASFLLAAALGGWRLRLAFSLGFSYCRWAVTEAFISNLHDIHVAWASHSFYIGILRAAVLVLDLRISLNWFMDEIHLCGKLVISQPQPTRECVVPLRAGCEMACGGAESIAGSVRGCGTGFASTRR